MTKSPLAAARGALAVGKQALPAQSSKYSRKDYTLPQLFALLVLKRFFRTDNRGVVEIVRDCGDLREALGLAKVPDQSTLWHVEQKLLQKGVSTDCLGPLATVGVGAA